MKSAIFTAIVQVGAFSLRNAEQDFSLRNAEQQMAVPCEDMCKKLGVFGTRNCECPAPEDTTDEIRQRCKRVAKAYCQANPCPNDAVQDCVEEHSRAAKIARDAQQVAVLCEDMCKKLGVFGTRNCECPAPEDTTDEIRQGCKKVAKAYCQANPCPKGGRKGAMRDCVKEHSAKIARDAQQVAVPCEDMCKKLGVFGTRNCECPAPEDTTDEIRQGCKKAAKAYCQAYPCPAGGRKGAMRDCVKEYSRA